MTRFRARLWTGVGAAVLAGASLTLAACGGEGGEKGAEGGAAPAVGEGGEGGAEAGAASSAPVGEGGEGGNEGGGEAGAQAAFQGIPNESKVALRLAQLKGFVLIAQKQPDGPAAGGILLQQGLLETFDMNPDIYKAAGVDEAVLRKAGKSGAPADLAAALANIEAAEAKAGGDAIAVAKGMVSIASGLYQEAVKPGSVDPIDYQHSLGAALAAQSVLDKRAAADPRAKAAKPELTKFLGLWPQATAPANPTPATQVAAQASRVELELS